MAIKTKKEDVNKKPPKSISISSKIAMQNGGVLFELNETHSFNENDFSLDEINDLKIQLLANNLITLNNFQRQVEGTNE
jgi:hypothetical protein